MHKILVTDNGSHPPEKWAMLSAEIIFPTDGIEDESRVLLARSTQLAIANALLPIYTTTQDGAWDALSADPGAALAEPINPTNPTEAALVAVLAAVAGTPWEDHFADQAVQGAVLSEIGSHVATVIRIERDWAVNDFAEDPGVQAYVAAQADPGADA